MTPKQLSNKIKLMELNAPITKKFEAELFKIGRWNYDRELKKEHKNNQKIHWLNWLSEQDQPGAYKRKNYKNITAEMVYRRLACPPMLLWLCEKSGIKKSKIILAKNNALKAKSAYSSMCSAIREVIPWEIVENNLA